MRTKNRWDSLTELPISAKRHREYMDAFLEARETIAFQQSGSDSEALWRSIMAALKVLTDFYDADCAYVLRFDLMMNVGTNAFDWYRDGCEFAVIDHASFADLDTCPLLRHASAYEELIIPDVNEIKNDWPIDYNLMTNNGIKSFYGATFPKGFGEIGYVAISNPKQFKEFTQFLHLISFYIGMQIDNVSNLTRSNLEKRKQKALEPNDVRINILGYFEITTKTGSLTDMDMPTQQCCKLIVCLLRNRDRRHSIDDIFEMLWPDRIVDSTYEAVKSIVYRTRKYLAPIFSEPLIIAAKGSFVINPALNVILDTDMFVDLCREASNVNLSKFDRLILCREAIALYRGDLMSGVDISEHWLMTRRSRYRLTYADMMKTFIALLAEEERYTELVDAVSASQGVVFSDPQIQWMLIKLFLESKRYDLALNHFHVAEKILSNQQKTEFMNIWDSRE